MKKSMQKTMQFLTSLFFVFFSILDGFWAPKWSQKSSKFCKITTGYFFFVDFLRDKTCVFRGGAFWRPPASILSPQGLILEPQGSKMTPNFAKNLTH